MAIAFQEALLSRAYAALNLDANASYGVLPEVLELLQAGAPRFCNPSAIHQGGQRAKAAIEDVRSQLKESLGLNSEQTVVFTSGATESNNTALFSLYRGTEERPYLCTTTVEHPSVLESARRLERLGCKVLYLPVSRQGVDDSALSAALYSKPKLLSVMLANNETGQLFPLADIVHKVREISPQTVVHTDAVQAFGKIPLAVGALGVDLLSLSGHKIGALSGVGALIVNESVEFQPSLFGGPQEQRRRAGTENVLGIISLGLAVSVLIRDFERRTLAMKLATELFLHQVRESLPDVQETSTRLGLPNTLHLRIPGIRADDLVVALDQAGILISSGAACASGKPEPSHVLLALGMKASEARECVRISFTGSESNDQVLHAADTFSRCIARMRGESHD